MENNLGISDSLLIGIDISNGDDIAVMQVVRYTGNKCKVINTLFGDEAVWTYDHLVARPHTVDLDLVTSPESLQMKWSKVDTGHPQLSMPELLNKKFNFPAAGELCKIISCNTSERRIPNMRSLLDEMFPTIIQPKGEGDECV